MHPVITSRGESGSGKHAGGLCLSGGFTFVELVFLVLLMTLIIALLLPAVMPAHHAHRLNCTNNLKQMGLAFKTWSIDNRDHFPMEVSTNEGGTMELVKGPFAFMHFVAMSNELSTPRILICPQEPARKSVSSFSLPMGNSNVSYFVGLDATETNQDMFLAGDRDLTNGLPVLRGTLHLYTNCAAGWAGELHKRPMGNIRGPAGNLLFPNGTVQQVSSRQVTPLVQSSGVKNRLAMP